MDIRNALKKEDFGEPYAQLVDCLDLSDILKLEKELHGRQIRFNKHIIDISTEQRELVFLLGEAKALKVANILSGANIHFPSITKSCQDKIRALIKKDFNGYNYVELSRKYGYSERHVKRLVEGSGAKRCKELDGQLWLDEVFVDNVNAKTNRTIV